MAKVTLKGNTVNTSGNLPKVGSHAPDFVLTDGDLNDVTLENFKGKKKLLNIVHSLDTGVCATSTKKFEEAAKTNPNTAFLTISADLPFAQVRFCGTEMIKNVKTLSMMHDRHFAKDYGVLMIDGPLAGICARSVVVIDEEDIVRYTEQVPEISHEPDYEKALAALK